MAAAWIGAIPVIKSWFGKPQFTILFLSDSFRLAHWYGNLQVKSYICIKNVGNAKGMISQMKVFIKGKNSSFKIILPAKLYQPKELVNKQYFLPFTAFYLEAGEAWEGFVNFFHRFTLKESQQVQSLHHRALENAKAKYRSDTDPSIYKPYYIDEDLFGEISEFIGKKLRNFIPDYYYLLLMVWFDSVDSKPWMECYFFVVDEVHMKFFKNNLDKYRSAAGVFDPKALVTELTPFLTKITDQTVISNLYKSYLGM